MVINQSLLEAKLIWWDNCTRVLAGDIYHWCDGQLKSITSNAHLGAVFSIHRSAEGIASGGKDGTIKLWSSNLTLITTIDLSVTNLGAENLCLRSIVWYQDHILVGTKTSYIIDVDVKDRSRPRVLVGGHSEGAMWALATHPKKDVFVTGKNPKFLFFHVPVSGPVFLCYTVNLFQTQIQAVIM